jgi:predicted alpha/beta-hydrolase family hydrolase
MGGRITSHVAAHDPPPELRGLAFLGYPLHAPKKPAVKRAEHLSDIRIPMLFVQGTRDSLANLDLLRPIVTNLGDSATMHVVEGGDHSFKVLKRSGRTPEEVLNEITDAVSGWTDRI